MRGHIHKRVRRASNGTETTRWYVVLDTGRDADGRRRQKWHGGFRTRREAEVARAKLVNDLHSGSYVAPDRTTLAEWVRASWLPMIEARIKPSTFDSYRSSMETHVLPRLGARPLQQLTTAHLNALYGELLARGGERGPLTPKTVSYIHATIHKALSDAVDSGILQRTSPSGRSRRGRTATSGARSAAGSRTSSRDSWSRCAARGLRPPGAS
ncbi:MAG: hypothetical protein BroJett022_21360 [Actinomycetes bacterium]|nr:MAG: hypothetical protein BroJett022_21360 [Actinomycetes bacterium]